MDSIDQACSNIKDFGIFWLTIHLDLKCATDEQNFKIEKFFKNLRAYDIPIKRFIKLCDVMSGVLHNHLAIHHKKTDRIPNENCKLCSDSLLIDLYAYEQMHTDKFVYTDFKYESDEESLTRRPFEYTGEVIDPFDVFESNFRRFTDGMIGSHFPWENCVVAGGSMINALISSSKRHPSTDVDFWVYGGGIREE